MIIELITAEPRWSMNYVENATHQLTAVNPLKLICCYSGKLSSLTRLKLNSTPETTKKKKKKIYSTW